VQAGSPVNLTVVTKGAPSKLKLNYTYASTGGTITGNQEIASIDNTGTAAGQYKVTATVAQSGKHKHPLTAACEAEFKVKAKLAPPTTSTAARAEQEPKAAAVAEAGRAHAEVQDGAPSATRPTSPPTASKFATIAFERDAKRPTRVDNEAKAQLDRFADALAAAPDTKGIVVGYATAAKRAKGSLPITAALRAMNTKQYLSKDKGLDAARIEPYTGKGSAKKVELWMVPAGVNFTEAGTKAVDESKVKAVPRVPLKPRAHPRKATLRQQPK
jgi:outer membrane protein OmpA-like peptidoglycan-associated protein